MEKVQTHLKYGLYTGIAIIVVGLILHIANLSFEQWAQWVMYIPFAIGLFLNAQAFAKANNHQVTYGNVFGSCFKASAVITLIVLAWGLLSIFIFPEMKEKGMEITQERMAEQGMSDEQIEQGLEMSKKFFIPFMMGGIVFGYMLMGVVLSLIAAAIPKKTGNPTPFDNPDNNQQFQH